MLILQRGNLMKILFLVLIAMLFQVCTDSKSGQAWGQSRNSYAGVGYEFGTESKTLGNGASHQAFLVGSYFAEKGLPGVEAKAEMTVGSERKNYLDRNGVLFRATGIGRYWIGAGLTGSQTSKFSISPQAGVNYGYFKIGGPGGYAKGGQSFFYGAAVRAKGKGIISVTDFRWQPEIELHADSVANNSTLDGYSRGYLARTEIIVPAKSDPSSRLHYIVYAAAGRYVYRRAAVRYGNAAASVEYPYNVFSVGIGVAFK
jgi:hypothetical protein